MRVVAAGVVDVVHHRADQLCGDVDGVVKAIFKAIDSGDTLGGGVASKTNRGNAADGKVTAEELEEETEFLVFDADEAEAAPEPEEEEDEGGCTCSPPAPSVPPTFGVQCSSGGPPARLPLRGWPSGRRISDGATADLPLPAVRFGLGGGIANAHFWSKLRSFAGVASAPTHWARPMSVLRNGSS